MKPVVTEYQLHRLRCPDCGGSTRAELPTGVPMGGFGLRVQAIAALGTGAYHLSKRATQQVMTDLFGLPLSLGTPVNLEEASARAVAEPVAEARAYVQTQPAAYLDQTGWREGTQWAWLWTAVTPWGTVFVVRRSRSGQVAQNSWGKACGVVGDGSLERLHLVSQLAAAALLGPHAARYRSHDRGWRALAGDR